MIRDIPKVIASANEKDLIFYHYASMKDLPLSLIQFGWHHTPPGYAYGPAVRNHDLIHFVFEGRGELQLGEQVHALSPGQLFFIPSGQISRYQAERSRPWLYGWVGFAGDWGRELLHETGLDEEHPVAEIENPDTIRTALERMMALAGTPNSYVALLGIFYEILHEVSRYQSLEKSEMDFSSTGRKVTADQYVDIILTNIHRNFSKPFSVEELAESIGFSRPYLTKIFKRATGLSIQDYLTQQRMDYARLQLRNSDRPIAQIALDCGIPDAQYFARIFKKTVGVSPSAYREQVFQEKRRQGDAPVSDKDTAEPAEKKMEKAKQSVDK